jgi:23S rRNA (guanine745-N1)-methyltransferase
VGMGPHARHLSRGALESSVAALDQPVRVTVSVEISVYRAPGRGRPDGPTAVSG